MNTQVSQTKVAIIGLGNIGRAIATNLTKGNHSVTLASRYLAKANGEADQLGTLAVAKTTADAIKDADVVIPAISFSAIKDFLATYAKELSGKTIVDVSNPIAPNGNGGFKKVIGENESAGEILSGLVPNDAILVKAFGTLGAGSLKNAAFTEPERNVLFYASDSATGNRQIEELISSNGFAPVHVGGINQSIRIEVFGDLHEFGALGKTVILDEAKAKVQSLTEVHD